MEEIQSHLMALKKDVRHLREFVKNFRLCLDGGNMNHIYEKLDQAEETANRINRVLRDLGKTLDKHQKV